MNGKTLFPVFAAESVRSSPTQTITHIVVLELRELTTDLGRTLLKIRFRMRKLPFVQIYYIGHMILLL